MLSSKDQDVLLLLEGSSLPDCIVLIADPAHGVTREISDLPNVSVVSASSMEESERLAFAEVERRLRPGPKKQLQVPAIGKRVFLVGSGVVNLITALELSQHGFDIEIFDRMPNPLRTTHFPSNSTGATFGGMDARIFSLNESRHHLFRGKDTSFSKRSPFRKSVAEDGWLSRDVESFNQAERAWITRLESIPYWLSGVYNEDIIKFNRESKEGWKSIFSLYPQILRGVNFNNTLLRVYQTAEAFQSAIRSEENLGALRDVIPVDRLAKIQPCFAESIQAGSVSGALRVEGFSLNVIGFSRNLIRFLQDAGVTFHWNAELDALTTNNEGEVTGLRFGKEERMADHVVICPGAYAKLKCETLRPTRDIASMMGMWITLPNEKNPLSAPLKIRRQGFAATEAAEGANIIPGHDAQSRPVIYCSSGHSFIGNKPDAADSSETEKLIRCIKDTAQELFPDKYAEAERLGMLNVPPKYCVRPWTPSGLGIFDTLRTISGGHLILTGGHNTGGFAQAPAVAKAVLSTVNNQPHVMFELYNPQRTQTLTS
ncbi:MAG: FAD-binding oxidoreductase [Rhizobiales bacterium]|nr:FAD-binding oxidoreductase [Hyphomicrobiales bacterium]